MVSALVLVLSHYWATGQVILSRHEEPGLLAVGILPIGDPTANVNWYTIFPTTIGRHLPSFLLASRIELDDLFGRHMVAQI